MEKISLNELFDFFSLIRTKKIVSCGIPVYYNEAFKEIFLNIISSDPFGSTIKDEIKYMIDNGHLNVGFTSSNIVSDILNEIKRRIISRLISIDEKYRVLGLFCPVDGKVSIILDENTTIFKSAKKDRIVNVLFHELCHYFLFLYPVNFINSTKSVITKFYKNLFDAVKPIPLENFGTADKVLKDIGIRLMLRERRINYDMNILIEESYRLWLDAAEEIYDNDTKSVNKINSFIVNTFYALSGGDIDISEIINDVFRPFHIAYSKTFNVTNREGLYDIFYGQELLFPSEIIAISHNLGDKDLSHKLIKELI